MRSNIKSYLGICKLMGVFRNVCVSVLCIVRNHTYQHFDSIINLPWGGSSIACSPATPPNLQ